MDNQQHPITPPPELRRLWAEQARLMHPHDSVARQEHFATQAARWGDEQRLEACIAWLHYNYPSVNCAALRAAMRPKPPSLAEQALEEIQQMEGAMYSADLGCDFTATRAALERLKELENGNE